MNIEFIKSEIARLSQIVASWSNENDISVIEKELLLDKLRALYEAVRFETSAPAQPNAALPLTPMSAPEQTNDTASEDEPEVEVEFLFDEEGEEEEELSLDTLPTEEPATEEPATIVIDREEIPSPSPADSEPIEAVESSFIAEKPTEQETESVAEIKATTPTEEAEATAEEPRPSLGNLFGMEEPKRHTRSKHIRMMSLYDDNQTIKSREKSVDISKIIDIGIDTVELAPEEESPTKAKSTVTEAAISGEHNVTLADAIAPNQPTLADTISRPAPLAEEITNSKIASLQEGVGINDQFLMIRDLFDGDKKAYEKALHDLDAQESFDDCMIYIVENYAWNPDSEGAKFIMKLLERKHS